jgi:hypothetical protein
MSRRLSTLALAIVLLGPSLGAGQEARDAWRFPAPSRLIAIGDLHGDAAAARRALRLGGAIDDAGRWIGGELVVVQTGDQLDRNDDEIALLDLLDRLTVEAAAAGGAVHVLNGNHEFMNVQGKMHYVTAAGFAAFQSMPGLELTRPEVRAHPEGERARRAAFAPGGPFALRLARRDVVITVGDTVLVHGGVLPPAVAYGLSRLNAESREWLRGDRPEPPEILLSRFGPVWSRHFSDDPDEADCALLHRTLRMMGAARMVVGHTIQKHGIDAKCGGAVWCIDVGLSSCFGGSTQVLEIEGDRVRVLDGAGMAPRTTVQPPAAARHTPGGTATPPPS